MNELISILLKKKITISCAESITGGAFSSKIVSIPNASKCFKGGVVTYSNESKISILNIDKATLNKYGAVSKETALLMCQSANKLFKSTITISFTGNSGPFPMEGKEIGLVFIGIKYESYEDVIIYRASSKEREKIIFEIVEFGIQEIKKIIEKTAN